MIYCIVLKLFVMVLKIICMLFRLKVILNFEMLLCFEGFLDFGGVLIIIKSDFSLVILIFDF